MLLVLTIKFLNWKWFSVQWAQATIFWQYMAVKTFYHHVKQSQLHLKMNGLVYALTHQQRHLNRLALINNVKLVLNTFIECFLSCFLHTFWCSIKIKQHAFHGPNYDNLAQTYSTYSYSNKSSKLPHVSFQPISQTAVTVLKLNS